MANHGTGSAVLHTFPLEGLPTTVGRSLFATVLALAFVTALVFVTALAFVTALVFLGVEQLKHHVPGLVIFAHQATHAEVGAVLIPMLPVQNLATLRNGLGVVFPMASVEVGFHVDMNLDLSF